LSFLEIRKVEKRFGPIQVLRGLDMQVDEHQVVCLIGPSGCGKSTLLRCINGLEAIQGGEIRLDNDRVSGPGVDVNKLRQQVGIVFQSYNLFPHLSVERNITLAPTVIKKMPAAEARKLAETVLARVGLSEKIDTFPDKLSGGQQQRVAIARSLAMRPKLLLFDEVTSALDPELTGEVLKVLESLAGQGMTMMLVTHEMGFARNVANRVVFMHQGKVWEDGPARETLSQPRTPELVSFLGSVLH
jgi:polar amino acid transport system ATP-binding protein